MTVVYSGIACFKPQYIISGYRFLTEKSLISLTVIVNEHGIFNTDV